MKHQQRSQLDTALRLFPCLSCLPGQAWDDAEVLSVHPATPHSIREGHMLQHAMFLLSGSLRIHKLTPAGREVTLYRVQPGETCVLMLASLLGECEYEASVAIETDCEVLLFPAESLREWMGIYKPIRQFVYGEIVSRMTRVTLLLERIAYEPLPSRIAECLLAAANRTAAGALLALTHQAIAIEVGSSREVVTRCLRTLAADGIIATSRGQIEILNWEGLRALAARTE